MAKVFVVTSGQYEDYRIVGVFSTEEKAEEFIQTQDDNDYDIEEYGIDELEPDEEIHTWAVDITAVKKTPLWLSAKFADEKADKRTFIVFWDGVEPPEHRYRFIFFVDCVRKDEAIKIAAERMKEVVSNASKYCGLSEFIEAAMPDANGVRMLTYNFETGVCVCVNGLKIYDDFDNFQNVK
jgi:hypothetical protein